jgi:23S rRNA (uracil1939-C5)-methyltransferase
MGLFSLALSNHIKKSFVVDISKDSIIAGTHTANMNRIKNVEYLNLSFEDFEYPEGFDLLLDPPREGLSNEVVNKIKKVGPSKILYISCNLATFSRDLAKLLSFGYNMQYIVPFDMFPHTYHMETLTLLTKQEVIK